jgi:hypothetical protein
MRFLRVLATCASADRLLNARASQYAISIHDLAKDLEGIDIADRSKKFRAGMMSWLLAWEQPTKQRTLI